MSLSVFANVLMRTTAGACLAMMGGAAYADSRFARRAGGVGEEVMELCMVVQQGQLAGTNVRTELFL